MNCLRNEYPHLAKSVSPPLFGRPTERAYKAAVKQIILALKAASGLSSVELAPVLGCCKETIDNAEEEATNLNVVTLLNIAYAFGEEAIAPVRSLYLYAPPQSDETPAKKVDRLYRELARAIQEERGE
jgi:DNA-binding XRE family transcriptional regulator